MQTNNIQSLYPHLKEVQAPTPLVVQSFFPLQNQMPRHQINHYLKQASAKKSLIIVQLNPSNRSQKYVEVFGKIYYSKEYETYYMRHPHHHTPYLLNVGLIRHVRLNR